MESDSKTSFANAAASKPHLRKPLVIFGLFGAGLTLAFAGYLFGLVRFAAQNDLYSYVLLIPFVSGYLVWLQRRQAAPRPSRSAAMTIVPLVVGFGALGFLWLSAPNPPLKPIDRLALSTFSYLCFLYAGAFWFLGAPLLLRFAFPSAFLLFLVPLPTAMENGLEIFFQHASAEAAALLFAVTGSTVFRDGLVFALPGIVIQVAQECSGIRSTLVLFITSLLAGHLFLKSPWSRSALTLFVIPLAILRNGFRVFTLAMLCVHVDPSLIDSPIHHRGGPLFFALSLIPFFGFLLLLRRWERSGTPHRSGLERNV